MIEAIDAQAWRNFQEYWPRMSRPLTQAPDSGLGPSVTVYRHVCAPVIMDSIFDRKNVRVVPEIVCRRCERLRDDCALKTNIMIKLARS